MTHDAAGSFDRTAALLRVKRNAGQTLFPAILILVLGWVFLAPPDSPEATADYILAIMVWTLRFGGIVLLGAAALCRGGAPLGLLLDALISSWITIVLAATAVVFIIHNPAELMGWVFVLFAALYARAALSLWRDYPTVSRALRTETEAALPRDESLGAVRTAPEPHARVSPGPASGERTAATTNANRAESPSSTEEPPDGYLAGFGEKDSPSTRE